MLQGFSPESRSRLTDSVMQASLYGLVLQQCIWAAPRRLAQNGGRGALSRPGLEDAPSCRLAHRRTAVKGNHGQEMRLSSFGGRQNRCRSAHLG